MKISIIHPSKGRPEIALKTAKNWFLKADLPFEYILSLDSDGLKGYEIFKDFLIENKRGICINKGYIVFRDNKSAIEAINYASINSKGDIIIVISDDFDCPEHWDTLLLKALEGKKDFIVKTQDGLQKTLITLPIMDRTYYDRFGYIYHPDYKHMHCDEEMTIVGHMLGRIITLDLLFPHNHYTTGKFKKDAISLKNDSTWGHGQATLDRRAKNNFGIENPLIKREEIVWK